jgi:hypothetical protein
MAVFVSMSLKKAMSCCATFVGGVGTIHFVLRFEPEEMEPGYEYESNQPS